MSKLFMKKKLLKFVLLIQFQAAVEEMVTAKCPPQIANFEEGFVVKYFRDYETDFNLVWNV